MPFLSHDNAYIYLNVHVQPGAKKTAVEDLHNGRLKIRLAAPPIEGKANEALCRFLKERLQVALKNIIIVNGEKSRLKTIAIANQQGMLTEETIRAKLLSEK
jgi:uncharacterized protein (TIGR00251 family)